MWELQTRCPMWHLSCLNPYFASCIGVIDGHSIKFGNHAIIPTTGSGFMAVRRCIVWTIWLLVVSHKGLFIHLDLDFLGSFHNVIILCHSDFGVE
jgi:hypothetical protein